MEILGTGVATHKVRRALGTVAGALMLAGACPALAQTNVDKAPSEAARRAAMSPYRFILQNATAPARKPAPAKEAAPAPVVAAPARPAAPPVEQATAQPVAPAPEAAPAPAPAPEPAVAALSRKPVEPPPPKLEIIPIRTDEPHLSPALLREQPHGTVKVQFDIQPDGSTSEVKVLHSNNRALNRPTVDAVQGWKFQPVDQVLTVQTEVVYKMDSE